MLDAPQSPPPSVPVPALPPRPGFWRRIGERFAAFLAGAIDAAVGGGGLIQIPALFVVHPGESAATLFGTNKCASVVGTANATWRYARRLSLPWPTAVASGENYYLVWPKTRPGGERLRRLAEFLQGEVQAMVLPVVERLD